MDNEFNKRLGLNFDTLSTSDKIMKSLSGINLATSMSEKINKSMAGITPMLNIAEVLNSRMKTNNAWNYITEPRQKPLIMYEAMRAFTEKQNQYQNIFGGTTISNIAKFSQEPFGKPYNADLESINKIKDVININSKAYNAHINLSKSLASALSANQLFANANKYADIFSSQNYLDKKALNPFDVLSGASFANIAAIYGATKHTGTLDDEFSFLQKELATNKDLINETNSFVNEINSAKEDYQKIDEILTYRIHSFTSKFGWSLQRAHYFAYLLIFLCGVFGKYAIDAAFKSKPAVNNYITVNKFVTEPKSKSIDLIIKNAPVYATTLTSTRKLGTIKENTKVEILRNKSGWCYVESLVTIIKKSKGQKTGMDTIMQVWVQQSYLKNFQ